MTLLKIKDTLLFYINIIKLYVFCVITYLIILDKHNNMENKIIILCFVWLFFIISAILDYNKNIILNDKEIIKKSLFKTIKIPFKKINRINIEFRQYSHNNDSGINGRTIRKYIVLYDKNDKVLYLFDTISLSKNNRIFLEYILSKNNNIKYSELIENFLNDKTLIYPKARKNESKLIYSNITIILAIIIFIILNTLTLIQFLHK